MIIGKHKEKKFILINMLLLVTFLVIYFVLDISANDSYKELTNLYGVWVTVGHISMNILLAIASSVIVTWSFIALEINKKDNFLTNVPVLGVIIGFFTFGCTPCVVAFLSIFGITFIPLVFPNGNLLWKVIVLIIILIGGFFSYKLINRGCKVKN